MPHPDPVSTKPIRELDDALAELDASQKEDAPWDLANCYIMSQAERSMLRDADARDEADDFIEEHGLDELLEHRTNPP